MNSYFLGKSMQYSKIADLHHCFKVFLLGGLLHFYRELVDRPVRVEVRTAWGVLSAVQVLEIRPGT